MVLRVTWIFLFFAGFATADQFDHYTNPILAKAIADGAAKEAKELTSEQITELAGALPDSSSAFLVVATNDKRLAKLLVQPARQKLGEMQSPLYLVDKFTTFRGSSERAIQATASSLHLYPGSRLNLEIGQIVPDPLNADIAVVADEKGSLVLKPLRNAKLYSIARPIAGVVPKKAEKFVPGEVFETRFFAGKYKLHDDGRRAGVLRIHVNESGEISGTFTSDKDGREYDVQGKAGTPKHAVSFSIKFPATTQTFSGFIFTGDGRAIAGTTKMLDREAGFYAERVTE